jgi:GNAT superfamily N-acetyltransferase
VQIREAKREDMPQLIDLMTDYVVGFYRQEDQSKEEGARYLEFILNNPGEATEFVVEEDERLLGFATLYYSYSTLRLKRIAILNDLFIAGTARGRGYGEALFEHVRRYAEESGVAYLQWETTRDNVVAQSLYNKMGGELSDLLVYEIRFSGQPPQ